MKNLIAPAAFILLLIGCDGVTGLKRATLKSSNQTAYVNEQGIHLLLKAEK